LAPTAADLVIASIGEVFAICLDAAIAKRAILHQPNYPGPRSPSVRQGKMVINHPILNR